MINQPIKPIETQYKGYRFRSRLEARWAVFFDRLGIAWEYEKEGYDLGEAGWYLPDFWLPEHDYWIEIKGQKPSKQDCQKIASLYRGGGCKRPDMGNECTKGYECESCLLWEKKHSVLLLQGEPFFSPEMYEPAYSVWGIGCTSGEMEKRYPADCIIQCMVCGRVQLEHSYQTDGDKQTPWGYHCVACDTYDRKTSGPEYERSGCHFHKGTIYSPTNPKLTPLLQDAYTAARSARFEHGERP